MLLQDESIQKIIGQGVREAEHEERKLPQENVIGNTILVKTIVEKMYFPESDHMKRRIRSGKPLDAHSMKEGRTIMRTIIILWGDKPIASLKAEEIVQYLSGLDRSGSYKSNFISRVKEVYREAYWYGGDIPIPSFPVYKRNTRKTDTFTDWELERYFNPDIYEDSDMYLFYLCCLTAGLRPGEARGLCPKQILFDRKALMVDGFVKKNGVRTAYNKKKPGGYLKLRIVPLHDLTLRLLKEHIERKQLKDNDLCFTGKKEPSRPIAERYIYGYMARILKKADIQTWDRKLTINSFRYTYAASIRRELPAGTVMKLVGRKYIGMMELYTNGIVMKPLRGLPGWKRRRKSSRSKREHRGGTAMNRNNGGKVYIWSDLHLGHGNVIRYCNRPFTDVTEMNTALLHAWKSAVKNGDTIINLGDVGLKLNREYLATVIQRLPGYKILVMGNHDRKKPVRWWLDVGFNEVYPRPVVYEGKYILSHAMVDMFKGSGFINFHGHIHNLESGIPNCINVSVEATGYRPVLLENLVSGYEATNRPQAGENNIETTMRGK